MMAGVRHKDTKPELMVRSFLHRHGFRFRLHRKDLAGKPDIVLPKYRHAVFVHGCFWHQHLGCRKAKRPTTNTHFWDEKLDRNILRDRENLRALIAAGWTVLILWECQIGEERLTALLKEIAGR